MKNILILISTLFIGFGGFAQQATEKPNSTFIETPNQIPNEKPNTISSENEIGGLNMDIPAPPLEDKSTDFIEESLVQDGSYQKYRAKDRHVLSYDDIREADVLWSKRIWRVIDTREKLNLAFAYPKMPFVNILLDIISKDERAKIFIDDDFTMEAKRQL